MPPSLIGPWPVSPSSASVAAGVALRGARSALAEGEVLYGPADRPGLYVIIEPETVRIVGFWVVIGASWLEEGPTGAPSATPPLVEALLEGAVQELWWTLPVRGSPTLWRALVVLEWPEALAWRSDAPPPGLVPEAAVAPRPDQGEDVLWDARAPSVPPRGPPVAIRPSGPPPPRRSLLCLTVGHLERRGGLHRGRFAVARPGATPEDPWWRALVDADPAPLSTDPTPGPALPLPGGREGYPIAGWLTRALERWPPTAADLRPGTLPEHAVGAAWLLQSRRALLATLAVLLGVALLGLTLRFLAAPTLYLSPPAQTTAPQPAMSLCSADHRQFVAELRCQVSALGSRAGLPTEPVCSDDGRPDAAPEEDLQATFCGLLDRTQDAWLPEGRALGFGEEAVARACFNVLGRPYAYRRDGAGDEVDSARLLEDPMLRIGAATELLDEFRSACNAWRARARAQVEGQVLAATVGAPFDEGGEDPDREPARLRAEAVRTAVASMSAEEARCLRVGAASSRVAARYGDLCEAAPGDELPGARSTGWSVLGAGPARGALVDRYVAARFATHAPDRARDAAWSCWWSIERAEATDPGGALRGLWDVEIPSVRGRDATDHGRVQSQLELESALLALREGVEHGACWEVVGARLAAWPVLMPIGESGEASWPSVEQQLCGTICAAWYGLRAPELRWITRASDLQRCVDPEASSLAQTGRGLDRLALPLNAGGGGWIPPTDSEICAFHLIAQGLLPPDLLGEDRGAIEWAGEARPRSGIAGGLDGSAARALSNMNRYGAGAGFGYRSCRDVAAQCLGSALLDITAVDSGIERYRWPEAFQRHVAELALMAPDALSASRPWCAPVQPYLERDRDRAVIESPCQQGVMAARDAAENLARRLVRGPLIEEAP